MTDVPGRTCKSTQMLIHPSYYTQRVCETNEAVGSDVDLRLRFFQFPFDILSNPGHIYVDEYNDNTYLVIWHPNNYYSRRVGLSQMSMNGG